jgi:hypothetical protein
MVACPKILQILDHPLDLHAQGHALLFRELVVRHLGGLFGVVVALGQALDVGLLLLESCLDPFEVGRNLFNPRPYYHIYLALAKYRHHAFIRNPRVTITDIESAFISSLAVIADVRAFARVRPAEPYGPCAVIICLLYVLPPYLNSSIYRAVV